MSKFDPYTVITAKEEVPFTKRDRHLLEENKSLSAQILNKLAGPEYVNPQMHKLREGYVANIVNKKKLAKADEIIKELATEKSELEFEVLRKDEEITKSHNKLKQITAVLNTPE